MKKSNIILSLLIVLFSINTNAKIIYTDIKPDGMPKNGGIDVNGDGKNEYEFDSDRYWDTGANNVWSNGPLNDGHDVAKALTKGTIIDANADFLGGGDLFMMNIYANPKVPTLPLNKDGYVGLKITSIPGGPYYGWVRVMWNGKKFIYKDYAYQSTPNLAIKAGDKASTSIVSTKQDYGFVIYPNPAKNIIAIQNKLQKNISKIIIVNLLGKEIKQIPALNANNQTIDISDLSKGIYFLNVYNNKRIIGSQKMIID